MAAEILFLLETLERRDRSRRFREKSNGNARSGEHNQPFFTWCNRQPPVIGIFVVPRVVGARRDDQPPIVGQGGNRRIEFLCWVVSCRNALGALSFSRAVSQSPWVCLVADLGLHTCPPMRRRRLPIRPLPFHNDDTGDRRDTHRRVNGLVNSSSSLTVRWTNQTEIVADCGSSLAAT